MQKSEKEQMRQLKKEELKELQRQKLNVEQTTETLKKTYSEETIVPAQENWWDHAIYAVCFAKMLREKEVLYHEFCGLEERSQNKYKESFVQLTMHVLSL